MPTTARPQSYQRVQNTTSETVVKSAPGYVHRVVLSNPAGGAAGTCTLEDGSGTTVTVLEIAVGESRSIDIGVMFDTDIRVTNSAVGIDALIIYD